MTFRLPVSCVEQGRWHAVSRHFQTQYYATPRLRADKVRSVQRQGDGDAMSDQGQVWQNVAEVLSDMKVDSMTGSLTDAYEKSGDVLKAYREKLALPKNATGVLVASGKEVIGLDLFESPKVLQSLWPRISDSYFLEAARGGQACRPTPAAIAEDFLTRVPRNLRPSKRASSAGTELDVDGPGLVGTAVWFQDRLCHLSAFTLAEDNHDTERVVQ